MTSGNIQDRTKTDNGLDILCLFVKILFEGRNRSNKILCLWCHEERKPQLAFSETSSNGLCETCYEGLFASVLQKFSWKQKLGFFFRRLLCLDTAMPWSSDRDDIVPTKRLLELIFMDLLKRSGSKIRFTFQKYKPLVPTGDETADLVAELKQQYEYLDENYKPIEPPRLPKHDFIVAYLLEDGWHEIMRLPANLHATMMSRLKLMANISNDIHAPTRGKIFFRHAASLLQFDDTSIGLVVTEELFLINFQAPLDQDDKPTIVELTWVPSEHAKTPAIA